MKIMKRFVALCFVLILVLSISSFVFADELSDTDRSSDYHVFDDANLLSNSEWSNLEDYATRISKEYECGIYIVTVDDFTDYTNTGDVLDAAENIYTGMDFGYGSGKDGQLLLLSMDDRDYALIAYGDFANTAFTDYGKDLISEAFLDNFRRNDWYGGFYDYLDECEYQLKEAKAGNPVDIWIPDDPGVQPYPTVEVKPTFMDYVSRYLFGLIPGSIISLITCAILRSKSKTVRIATDANRYVENGLQLRVANEMFLHRSQTRRVIEQSDRGSHLGGGGHMGGTTIHSSGFSGKSGKF